AEDQAIDFLKSMVVPDGLEVARFNDKAARTRNNELEVALDDEMDNPPLEDTVGLIEKIVRREAPNFVKLGKQLMLMVDTLTPKTAPPEEKSKKTSTRSTARKSSAA